MVAIEILYSLELALGGKEGCEISKPLRWGFFRVEKNSATRGTVTKTTEPTIAQRRNSRLDHIGSWPEVQRIIMLENGRPHFQTYLKGSKKIHLQWFLDYSNLILPTSCILKSIKIKINLILIFTLLCGAAKDFMKASKAFIKPVEAPQRSLKKIFRLIFSLRPGLGWEGFSFEKRVFTAAQIDEDHGIKWSWTWYFWWGIRTLCLKLTSVWSKCLDFI